jgi:hypothetical protein
MPTRLGSRQQPTLTEPSGVSINDVNVPLDRRPAGDNLTWGEMRWVSPASFCLLKDQDDILEVL